MSAAHREEVKAGRKRREINLEVVRQLAADGLSRTGISKRLHFNRSMYEERADVLEAVETGEADREMLIVGKLMEKVRAGDTIAAIYLSKVCCGYSETASKEPEIDPAKSIVIYLPDNKR